MGSVNKHQPGCCCGAPACGTLTVTVKGCLLAVEAGAKVTLKQGGTAVATGTTDGGGRVAFPVPAAGGYTVEVAAAHYTKAVSVSLGCSAQSLTVAPTCHECTVDWPATLTLTDSFGDLTLTREAGADGTYTWKGCRTVVVTGTTLAAADLACCPYVELTAIDLPVAYKLGCQSGTLGTAVQLSATWLACGRNDSAPDRAGCNHGPFGAFDFNGTPIDAGQTCEDQEGPAGFSSPWHGTGSSDAINLSCGGCGTPVDLTFALDYSDLGGGLSTARVH